MPTIHSPSLQETQYSGDAPAAHAHGYHTLAANPAGDKVRVLKLFAGTKIYGAKTVAAALGAATTLALGFEYADGQAGGSPTALLPAAASTAAGARRSDAAPIVLEYDAYIIVTTGGGVTTGRVDVVIDFAFAGK